MSTKPTPKLDPVDVLDGDETPYRQTWIESGTDSQTGIMLASFRALDARGLIGVRLISRGAQGVLCHTNIAIAKSSIPMLAEAFIAHAKSSPEGSK